MRNIIFIPMMLIMLLFSGCAGQKQPEQSVESIRNRYQEMSGCSMRAGIACEQDGLLWQAELQCEYVPGGICSVEVLSPEEIAGVRAVLEHDTWYLRYEGKSLNAGTVSREKISPAAALPRLMDILRNGWILEENPEIFDEIPCLRLALDRDGMQDGKIYAVVWLRQDTAAPVRGELRVDGQTVLTAEFSDFRFYETALPET